jgi:hypothetical protein
MLTISARIGAAALVCVALSPAPAARAFGLHIGPFHLHLPFPGSRRHSRIARSESPSPPESAELMTTPTLIYPILVWPSLYNDIFWPGSSPSWRFGYEDIFDQAFARYAPERLAGLCPYRDMSAEIVARIARETSPTDAQKPQLQKLATALGQANGYLIKSCPSKVPPDPVARLQLMNAQIDATIMALNIVRPSLQAFEQSLDEQQRARLDGTVPTAASDADTCRKSVSAREPFLRLEQAVRPTEPQREAMRKVRDAFTRAAADLTAACLAPLPGTALGRLEAIEGRLDAAWRATLTIEVALANLQKKLNDEQNARFTGLVVVSTR